MVRGRTRGGKRSLPPPPPELTTKALCQPPPPTTPNCPSLNPPPPPGAFGPLLLGGIHIQKRGDGPPVACTCIAQGCLDLLLSFYLPF